MKHYSEERKKALLSKMMLPYNQIVPQLADRGIYLCSELTMYRLLHAEEQQHLRLLHGITHKGSTPIYD